MALEPQHVRWWNLREAYRAVFERGQPQPVHISRLLDDLREFCRADQTCIVVAKDGRIDTHATAVAEGRREVFLRIQATLALTDSQLNHMKELDDE
jgi:hypothetical protein